MIERPRNIQKTYQWGMNDIEPVRLKYIIECFRLLAVIMPGWRPKPASFPSTEAALIREVRGFGLTIFLAGFVALQLQTKAMGIC